MSVLTQPPTMGDVLKYELNHNFTRETVTLLAGTSYAVGAVLGRITASGKMKLSTATGTDGAQNAAAVLLYDGTRQRLIRPASSSCAAPPSSQKPRSCSTPVLMTQPRRPPSTPS